MPDLVGQAILNQYQVEAFIAQTPLGEYYRVTDTWHNRPLGLIILPKSIADDSEALKQIESDSKQLREIRHSNLVPYLGLYQTPKFAFLLEEWIDGPTLREVLERGPIAVSEALIYLKSICAGLRAVHKQGYLHLSLWPELIHINRRGEIFLGGLGGARASGTKGFLRAGHVPALYAAPEQFRGEQLTEASDIYALAALLYQLITGMWISGRAAPRSLETIRHHHLETDPPPPILLNHEIPDHFSRMLTWALRKKPSDRLRTATELLTSLALAAEKNLDEIPLRVEPAEAPGSPASGVTGRILSEWKYLPPPAKSILADDKGRIDERIAKVAASQAKQPKSRFRFLPALGFFLIAGFISLFFFIRPAPLPSIPTPVYLTPFVAAQFTPPPTQTLEPKPTHAPGNRIAFTCTRGDYNQICMIDFDGTNLAQLSDIQASNYYPVFAPQGGSLLFSSNRNGAFDLWLLSFDEHQLVQLTHNIGNVVSPDYSPDGSRIVFVNMAADGTSSLWVVNADGLNPHMIYQGLNTIVAANWSPDGQTIAYAMSRGVVNEYEIFLIDKDGKNSRQVSRGLLGIGGSVDWSPDGRYLLIYAGPVGDKNIFRIDVASGDASQLTHGGNNAAATYSPDGKYIAYNSLRNEGQADIYIAKADGSTERRLTNNPEPDWGPQWEP